ncbi:MAG: filamentous hemagglutinin N-terminal domain-containing protein, partial [Verrucomicrobia bacterium]|nr:filamentous hemagglutinin N-terminal domain-containing protein [Verrucomicrobiota bacterium]
GTAGNGSGNATTVARLRSIEADQLVRTTQALAAVHAMQTAARNIAAGGPNNLGMNPNNPKQPLPDVPNGLTAGGLQIAPGAATPNSSLWQNANLPTQSTANGQTTVTIQQTAAKAILTWQTFNVGKNTTAYFNQSAGTQTNNQSGTQSETNSWIALNRVLDPSGVPSQILGSIKAEGQVYLINRNGIIFGGGSQVNVNTLVASTLNIPDAAFNQGFLAYMANNYNSSAVFSNTMGNAGPSAGNTFPSFSRFYQNSDTGAPTLTTANAPSSADVVVQPGASITTSEGGRVILLGAHVKNGGTISTPDGQTILAAGDSAYLYANPTAQMRGLSVDVLIDPNTNNPTVNPLADTTVGTTTNSGLITVAKGNATLDGASVIQNGVISALTGVDFNGSIIVTARYAPDTTAAASNGNYISPTIPGSVTFGPYSVTEILPDLSDPTTTLDAQGFNPSVIVVQGKTVAFEGASFPGAPPIGSNGQPILPGAQLIAPAGTVSVTAPVSYGIPSQASNFTNAFGLQSPFPFGPIYATSAADGAGARIFIDNGVTIDVSGTQDVSVPVSRNVVAVNLRANELRDSPLQRNGPLHGQTIDVEIDVTGTNADGSTWYGTPFADASGYIALIGRTVAERTAIGGAINLISAGDVVAVNGSTMNVSGGWLDYQSGIVSTTRLLGTDGQLYDIANADPNLTYVGIPGSVTITHPKWGVTDTFNTPLVSGTDQRFEQGYLDGRSAGSIAITANKMILDGTLLGNSVSGPRQRTINANVDSSVPLGGSLTLQAPPDTAIQSTIFSYANAIQDDLIFVTGHAGMTPAQALSLADGTLPLSDPSIVRDQTLLLPVDIFSTGGFTTLSTEASSNVVTTTAAGSSTKTITTTSPFSGNIYLPQTVALDFGTAASATLNFNYDGTVARNADGTISTVNVNTNNSANLTVDAYGNVDLEGSITALAGKIAFNAGVLYGNKLAFDQSYLANPPSVTVGSVQGSTPTFRLRGQWTNETKQTPDNTLQPLWINGGSFSLSAPGAITISSGSVFDVTGGGWLHSTGKIASSDMGKGGNLSL